jgi:hypothetical protein
MTLMLLHEALRDLKSWLEDMIDLRKLTNVTLYNPCDALSMTGPDMDVDRALELWGNDPVHPTETGYAALAQDIRSLCELTIADARARTAAASAPAAPPSAAAAGTAGETGGLDSRLHTCSKTLRPQHSPEGQQLLTPLAPKNQQGPRPKRRKCRPTAQRRRAAAPTGKLQTWFQRQG